MEGFFQKNRKDGYRITIFFVPKSDTLSRSEMLASSIGVVFHRIIPFSLWLTMSFLSLSGVFLLGYTLLEVKPRKL